MTAHRPPTARPDRRARSRRRTVGAQPWQVTAAVALLDGGATVPFIARYRKEATGSLDDAQLRILTERLDYLRELEDRRAAIVESITAQGKLTDALAAQIAGGRHQVPAGGHLPAVQAEAPHQGADRPRGRPGTVGRPADRRPDRGIRQRCRSGFRRRRARGRRSGRGAGRCPRDPGREIR